ncbi:MAG: N-acetylmannosamine-6-phosphate 2-epimerase [Mycoplasmoidaceae bacterium]
MKNILLEKFKNNLIVSCQAFDDEPLNNTNAIGLMAKSVVQGGAKALRLCQKDHIKQIMTITDLPMMCLIKADYDNSEVFITPTFKEVDDLIEIGAKCIATDATNRKRPNQSLEEIVNYIRSKDKDILIMADCATIEDVKRADQLDFDLIGTTLTGNTKESKGLSIISNNYGFIKECLNITNKPIIAEGGIWEPYEVKDLLDLGCYGVVVGSAITRPRKITEKFIRYLSVNNN